MPRIQQTAPPPSAREAIHKAKREKEQRLSKATTTTARHNEKSDNSLSRGNNIPRRRGWLRVPSDRCHKANKRRQQAPHTASDRSGSLQVPTSERVFPHTQRRHMYAQSKTIPMAGPNQFSPPRQTRTAATQRRSTWQATQDTICAAKAKRRQMDV